MRCVVALIMFTLGSSIASRAEIVRLKLAGKIEVGDAQGILPEDIVTGNNFVALWSYDTSVPDSQPELPYSGRYVHPLADPLASEFGLVVRINEHVFRMNTLLEPYTVGIGVGRLAPADFLNRGDSVVINQTDVLIPFEYDTPMEIEDRIHLFFTDSLFSTIADSSLTSDALPAVLDPAEFGSSKIRIDGFGSVSVGSSLPPSFNIEAFIDQVTAVPEPSTECLTCMFIALLLWLRN